MRGEAIRDREVKVRGVPEGDMLRATMSRTRVFGRGGNFLCVYFVRRAGIAGVERRPGSDMLMERLSVRPRSAPCSHGPREWYRQWTAIESHHWIYGARGVLRLFREAGFANPAPRPFPDSASPTSVLAIVEHADRIQDGAGVWMEARG